MRADSWHKYPFLLPNSRAFFCLNWNKHLSWPVWLIHRIRLALQGIVFQSSHHRRIGKTRYEFYCDWNCIARKDWSNSETHTAPYRAILHNPIQAPWHHGWLTVWYFFQRIPFAASRPCSRRHPKWRLSCLHSSENNIGLSAYPGIFSRDQEETESLAGFVFCMPAGPCCKIFSD